MTAPTTYYTKPKVEVLGQTTWCDPYVEAAKGNPLFQQFDFEDICGDQAKIVEFAGRLCYYSFEQPRPGGNKAYIDNIVKVGHGSVLEHVSWSFYLQGVSRSFTHELVRHRAGVAYSQLSQRYVDPERNPLAFVVPPIFHQVDDQELYTSLTQTLAMHCTASEVAYKKIQADLQQALPSWDGKKIKEAARAVLPNCTETKIVFTVNARALRHFLEMRGSLAADAEMREVALAVYDKVKDNVMFADFVTQRCHRTGYQYLECEHHKV